MDITYIGNLTNGDVDPDITDALSVVAPGSYTIYVPGYNDLTSLQALRDDLDVISGPLEQRPAVASTAFVGDVNDAIALAGGLNASRISLATLKASQSPSWEIAAAYGTTMAFSTDPALPFDYVALLGIAPPSVDNRLLGTEIEAFLQNGVTPLKSEDDGIVRIVRAISTYTLAPEGVEDPSLLDITTIRSLDYVRLALRTAYLLNFSRPKLTADTMTAIIAVFYAKLILLQAMQIVQNVEENKSGLIIEKSITSAGRANVKVPADIVQGLHVLAGEIDLII